MYQQGPLSRDELDNVLKAGRRAADLVKQILAFSRRDEEEMAPVQLSSVVKNALKLLRSSIPPHIAIVQNISNGPTFRKRRSDANPSINHEPVHQCLSCHDVEPGRNTRSVFVA